MYYALRGCFLVLTVLSSLLNYIVQQVKPLVADIARFALVQTAKVTLPEETGLDAFQNAFKHAQDLGQAAILSLQARLVESMARESSLSTKLRQKEKALAQKDAELFRLKAALELRLKQVVVLSANNESLSKALAETQGRLEQTEALLTESITTDALSTGTMDEASEPATSAFEPQATGDDNDPTSGKNFSEPSTEPEQVDVNDQGGVLDSEYAATAFEPVATGEDKAPSTEKDFPESAPQREEEIDEVEIAANDDLATAMTENQVTGEEDALARHDELATPTTEPQVTGEEDALARHDELATPKTEPQVIGEEEVLTSELVAISPAAEPAPIPTTEPQVTGKEEALTSEIVGVATADEPGPAEVREDCAAPAAEPLSLVLNPHVEEFQPSTCLKVVDELPAGQVKGLNPTSMEFVPSSAAIRHPLPPKPKQRASGRRTVAPVPQPLPMHPYYLPFVPWQQSQPMAPPMPDNGFGYVYGFGY